VAKNATNAEAKEELNNLDSLLTYCYDEFIPASKSLYYKKLKQDQPLLTEVCQF